MAQILIKNGTVVNAEGEKEADVLIEDEYISAIGKIDRTAETVIDAKGCYVFPGFIDPHTHLELSPHLFTKDSEAALLGGTTAVIEYTAQRRGQTLSGTLEKWHEMASGSSIDYGFHMGVAQWNENLEAELADMVHAGITSFKMYMAYDDLRVSDLEIYRALKAFKRYNVLLCMHCENGDLVDAATEETVKKGVLTPSGHSMAHPAVSEVEAIARFLYIARMAKMPAYVVHLSTKEGLEIIRRVRKNGQVVYAETCPQYLVLSEDCYHEENGQKYIMSPPLRTKADCESLWEAVSSGEIQTIGTDHCSFSRRDKIDGADDFRKAKNGCPGIEHRGVIMYTEGVLTGKISKSQFEIGRAHV